MYLIKHNEQEIYQREKELLSITIIIIKRQLTSLFLSFIAFSVMVVDAGVQSII